MMWKRRSAIFTVLLSCLILAALALNAYSQQQSGTPQSPGAQKPEGKEIQKRTPRYPAALAGLEVIADLTVTPAKYEGPCPAKFTFKGKISVNRPATVQYRFIRSDNVRHALGVLTFDKAGTQEVMDTWEFDDPSQLPKFKGWEAIQVNLPMKIQSNLAYFEGICTDYKGGAPTPKKAPQDQPEGSPESAPKEMPWPQPDPQLPPVKR